MPIHASHPRPTMTLRFEPDGQSLTGDFDSGTPVTFISYEWLRENGLASATVLPQMAAVLMADRDTQYLYSVVQLKARLVMTTSSTQPSVITVQAVRNWHASPFARGANRFGLIGMDVLRSFGATVEIDGATGETRITTQNWASFEAEVAELFRDLGLSVQRNYNLAGNQVDIFLSERTTSGKELRTIVECKFHRNPVGNQYVRQLTGILDFARTNKLADHAVLVSSAGFTKDARLVAEAAGVELLELSDLRARARSISGHPPPPHPAILPEIKEEPRQRTAFVIMPFKDEFRDTYMLGIREILSRHGFTCRRADEVEFNGRIMTQILDLIDSSDVIVAEVSEQNANVYFELGICQAKEKVVILCTKNLTQVPFDTRDLNHIVYSDIVDLRDKLAARLKTLVLPMPKKTED